MTMTMMLRRRRSFWGALFVCASVGNSFRPSARLMASCLRSRSSGAVAAVPTTTRLFLDTNGSNNNNNKNNNANTNGFDVNGFPYDAGQSKPSKADLYSNDELENLLNLHQTLSNEDGGFFKAEDSRPSAPTKDDDGSFPFGIHDMVLQAINDVDAEPADAEPPSPEAPNNVSSQSTTKSPLSDVTRRLLLGVRAIASDVDGTLVSSDTTVHPRTKEAVVKAVEAAFSPVRSLSFFFPATGKTRMGALKSLGPELSSLLSQCPGVFVQGLYTLDASGKVVYEEKLKQEQADCAIQFAEARGLSVFCYDGDKILATPMADPRHVEECHSVWGEPTPIIVDTLMGYEPRFHKCLVWCDDAQAVVDTIRPAMEELARETGAGFTQAIPTMLEILPNGASKAKGVRKLCEHLGIDMSTELVAIGDGENDIEFLQESAYGVAVGNAVPKTKASADFIMEESNNEGGAGLAIELFGLGAALE